MSANLHTFMDIFSSEVQTEEGNIAVKKIIIPIIQRDYAQGRDDPDILRVRTRFLESLHAAVTGTPITLDFVYGDLDAEGNMIPLDGQQRLTTLFLLHWYAAKKCIANAPDDYAFLKNFTYETRYSARDFCSYLIDYTPSFTQEISEEIVDQAWFPLDWKKDPTVDSMLTMLDAIDAEFSGVPDLWKKLESGAVSFYFLPIKDMGLTDELYIKMNSRGKPLTLFEHFKAELERSLRKIDDDTAKRILRKIDRDWTDMLWTYRGEDNIIDDEFLRYFRFVCDVLCYQAGGSVLGKNSDEFDLLKEFFSPDDPKVSTNIKKLESYFDCWCALSEKNPTAFLDKYISEQHEDGKIRVDKVDLFGDCLLHYGKMVGNGNREFPLGRFVLLFAIVTYLEHKDTVTEDQFRRRLRVINNMVRNSEDQIRDSVRGSSGNRMPAIVKQVEEIICTGIVDPGFNQGMNAYQVQEEADKMQWVDAHPHLAEKLYALEDHDLLLGQIGIVGLDDTALFDKFADLFKCSWDKVDCALMATDFYGQKEKNEWRYQLGTSSNKSTKAWRNLFHKSSNAGFDETKRILRALLDGQADIDEQYLDAVKENYMQKCEREQLYPMRYYYLKYDYFRPDSHGKYRWDDFEKKPYAFSVMMTETKLSSTAYQPFLRGISQKHLSPDDYGQRLIYGKKYIEAENNAYVVYNVDTGAETERISISQNTEGIDTEDRIAKMRKLYPAD